MKSQEGKPAAMPRRLIWIGIGISTLYWLIETVIDTYFFHQGSLSERILPADANEIWMRLFNVSLIIGFAAYVHSLLNRRRKAEQDLRESESVLREAQENAHFGSFSRDLKTGKVIFSDEVYRLFGYAPGEVSPSFDFVLQHVHPDDREDFKMAVDALFANREPLNLELRMICKDGQVRTTHTWGSLKLDSSGKPIGTVGSVQDITELQRHREVLQFVARATAGVTTNAFFRALVKTVASALQVRFVVAATYPDSPPTRVRTLAVWTPEGFSGPLEYELAGTPCAAVAGGEVHLYRDGLSTLFPQAAPVQLLGAESYLGIPLLDSTGKANGQLAVLDSEAMEDTEIKKEFLKVFAARAGAELERMRTEEELKRLALAIEHAAESILISDTQGRIQYANPAFIKNSGYTRQELIGQDPRKLKSGKHDEALYRQMWDTITEGRIWTGSFINERKDGSVFREDGTISPIRDVEGEITNYVQVSRDVSREADLEAQLRQAQKMEAIGTLAGGIAHDFNNLLQAMLGYTDLAKADVPAESETFDCLEQVSLAGKRASDLVAQILAFSRQTKEDRKPVWLQPIIKETMKLLRASLPSTIALRQQVDPHCAAVQADPTAMQQTIMNLCSNAYDAMRSKGGILEIGLREAGADGEPTGSSPNPHSGGLVRLTVRDTGHGMNQSIMDRIFDPFFTTKEVGKGTGIGLSTVHGIVKSCGGTISVESEPGKGTTFKILIPSVAANDAPTSKESQETAELGGKERLLLVDDEELVLRSGKMGLERLGYQIEACTSSLEALELFRAAPNGFDAVITDQTMPDMTGLDLARQIMQIRSDIPVILCTGFSELVDETLSRAAGIREFVRKPILVHSLAGAVRKALEPTAES